MTTKETRQSLIELIGEDIVNVFDAMPYTDERKDGSFDFGDDMITESKTLMIGKNTMIRAVKDEPDVYYYGRDRVAFLLNEFDVNYSEEKLDDWDITQLEAVEKKIIAVKRCLALQNGFDSYKDYLDNKAKETAEAVKGTPWEAFFTQEAK